MRSVLAILFNQDFSRNIPKLERIYAQRFTERCYIVPDHNSRLHKLYRSKSIPVALPYTLDRAWNGFRRFAGRRNPHEIGRAEALAHGDRIIRVVGHQFYFYHFIVQAAERLLAMNADWYWIVGDDAVLNPGASEDSMASRFDLGGVGGPDAVLCRPVISSDDWLRRIEGSPEAASSGIRRAMGRSQEWCEQFALRSEEGAVINKDVPVACVDFIGLSRGLLERSISVLRSCFRERLYVELGFPNAILSTCARPVFIDDYVWERSVGIEKVVEMVEKLRGNPETIFAHPIKLSALDGAMIDLMAG